MRVWPRFRWVGILTVFLLGAATAQAQIPSLNSRPGAAYTVYLDFGGFTFNGIWGDDPGNFQPGTAPAYGTTSDIRDTWARVAEKYAAFDINVTTVDPAVAAGQAGSDAQRQVFYDATPRLMHTVIGGNSNWLGGPAGGVSYVDVIANSYDGTGGTNGLHTNFVFPDLLGAPNFIAEAASHENGHGLGLEHQSDFFNGKLVTEYSGDGFVLGNGSYAPVMGNAYYSQRGVWRVGTKDTGEFQNDVGVIAANSGMTILDDGIGHSFAAATSLPLLGTNVNAALAQGVITPLLVNGDYNPLGVDNYRKDYFKFTVGLSSAVSLNVTDGGDWLTPGVASNGATLRAKLNIYSDADLLNPIGTATEAPDTLSTTFAGTLAPGTYYAEVTSFGGYHSTYDTTARYFEMGSFLLTGSGFVSPAPEPAPLALLTLGLAAIGTWRRRFPGSRSAATTR